jgi:hypothetical protein
VGVEDIDARRRSRSQFVRFAMRTGGPRGKSVADLDFVRPPSSFVVDHLRRRPSSKSVVENLCRGPPVRTSDSETNRLWRWA